MPRSNGRDVGPFARSWVVAVAVAAGALVVIGVASVLLGGSDGSVVPLPPAEVSTTTAPTGVTTTTFEQPWFSGVNAVEDIAVADDGTLYALTAGGVAIWDTATEVFEGMVPLTGLPGIPAGTARAWEIQHIEVADDGTLYAAGIADIAIGDAKAARPLGWVAAFDGSQWSIPVASDTAEYGTEMPVFDAVTDLAIGPEWTPPDAGQARRAVSVWVISGNRIIFFDGVAWWDYPVPEDLSPSSIDVGPKGEVWLGTDNGGGPWRFSGGVFPWYRAFSDMPGEADITLPSMYTHQVAVASDGIVWMATEDRTGIITLDEYDRMDPHQRVTVYTTADGLLANSGSIVVGENHIAVIHDNGVSRFNSDSWTHTRADLEDALASKAVLDADGVLWVPTTSTGFLRIEDAAVRYQEIDPGKGGSGLDVARSTEQSWQGPREPISMTLDPAVVPARPGVVPVTVRGEQTNDHGPFVTVCPGARGMVDPHDWYDDLQGLGQCGEASFQWDGQHTNPSVERGRFETVLEQSIANGGVVIVAGDMFIPLRGTVLLQIVPES